MAFADGYLAKQARLYPRITLDRNLSGVIVIPCYSEPDIFQTLDSLCQCQRPKGKFAVIIVINYPANKAEIEESQHRTLWVRLEEYAANSNCDFIRFIPFWLGAVEKKKTGVGYARKVGMDFAISILNEIESPDSFILSLDADTTVSENYLTEAERLFGEPHVRQIVFPFEHPKVELPQEQRHAIMLYELHLYYYRLSLQYIGWPWPYHTLGSAFGVRASVYVEQGGMNSRNAGEDFYFLNKIFPLGGTKVAANAKVFPAARLSARIIFGTGPALKEILENGICYKTYRFESFSELRYFTENIDAMQNSDISPTDFVNEAPKALRDYWLANHFTDTIRECRQTSNRINTFRKRIYRNFDAFQIVKFLNFSHLHHFQKNNVEIEVCKLLQSMNISANSGSLESLHKQLQEINTKLYQ